MDSILGLITLFAVGTTFFSIVAAIYRFFLSLVVSPSPSVNNQSRFSRSSDSKSEDPVSLKDAFYANENTRQRSGKNSTVGASQKRNQQTRSTQTSSRVQQEATNKRAVELQQDLKKRSDTARSSSSRSTNFRENNFKQDTSQTSFGRTDLTTLVPIEKVTSKNKMADQSRSKKNQNQRDFVKGMIYKQILDEPLLFGQ